MIEKLEKELCLGLCDPEGCRPLGKGALESAPLLRGRSTIGGVNGSLSHQHHCACSGSTYNKLESIQRRLAWPLRKDDTQTREAFPHFDLPGVVVEHQMGTRACRIWLESLVFLATPHNRNHQFVAVRRGGNPLSIAINIRLSRQMLRFSLKGIYLSWDES